MWLELEWFWVRRFGSRPSHVLAGRRSAADPLVEALHKGYPRPNLPIRGLQPVDPGAIQSVDTHVLQLVDLPIISPPVDQSVDLPTSGSISESPHQWINQWISPPVDQSVKLPTSGSISGSPHQWFNQWISPPVDQSVKLPTSGSISESPHQWINQWISPPVDQSVNLPTSESWTIEALQSRRDTTCRAYSHFARNVAPPSRPARNDGHGQPHGSPR